MINAGENLFSDNPFFNEKFIAAKNIRVVTTEFHLKKDHEKMINKGVIIRYDFNKNGKLIRQYTTNLKQESRDTSFVFYTYDKKGKLTVKRKINKSGLYAINFIYDEAGNILQQVSYGKPNYNSSAPGPSANNQYQINIEKFEFNVISPAYYTKKFLNNSEVPYREISYLLNENGKIIEETNTLLSIRKMERKQYSYNAEGKLVRQTEFSSSAQTLETIYVYNEQGWLTQIEKSKNAEPVQRTEFMLGPEGLITNQLSRNFAEKIIHIIKFRYAFY